jgi:hypothetical protein
MTEPIEFRSRVDISYTALAIDPVGGIPTDLSIED